MSIHDRILFWIIGGMTLALFLDRRDHPPCGCGTEGISSSKIVWPTQPPGPAPHWLHVDQTNDWQTLPYIPREFDGVYRGEYHTNDWWLNSSLGITLPNRLPARWVIGQEPGIEFVYPEYK